MTDFSVQNSKIEDVKIITPFYVEDNRGFFLKSYEKSIFAQMGLDGEVSEDFESYSVKNVIRGMHFQAKNPQIKLVRAVTGIIHDVAIDLRLNSPTFGQYVDAILSGENHKALWIPAGFAHGFEVLSDDAIVSYKCVGAYERGSDEGICWNDPDVNVLWETKSPILSERDANHPSLKEFVITYGGLGI